MKTREIKFRAWNSTKGEMIHSSLQKEYDDYHMLNLQGEFFPHTRTGDNDYSYSKDELNKHEYVLLQFTGLKDKNGKEIYDGDIVFVMEKEGREYKSKVFWDDTGRPSIFNPIHGHEGRYYTPTSLWWAVNKESCEIIGNIYENPELLQQ